MKLQIAVDPADTRRALEIADAIHDVIDIFEVGTPMIMREGVLPVQALKEKYPAMTVLADSKIMDGGALEAGYLCDAGADIITVLAVADDATVDEVTRTAHSRGRLVMADLLCVPDIAARARQLTALGADFVCVHTGTDVQKLGRTPLKDLTELVASIPPQRSAVAGGVSLATVSAYSAMGPGIIVAGAALYGAKDVRKAVVDMKEAMLR